MELIKNPNFDFIGKRKIMYLVSLCVIIAGIISFVKRGKGNFGVDFTGGDILHLEFNQKVNALEIRRMLKDLKIANFTVQILGREGREVIIRSSPGTSDTILSFMKQKVGEKNLILKGKSIISPSMSKTLIRKAILAFAWGLIGILFYITIRFEFRFAVGATIAIFHDLLVVLSILTLLKKQIDTTVIAALLTIAGYSVNDTVVVFDRIRENLKRTRSTDYFNIFNRSINETLSRTILTSLTTLFVVFCIFFFGGEALHTFSLALIAGFITGTYSSIFIASSLLIDWHRVKPHRFKL